tara:strand:+ start:53 stop:451 length:399 start_codon:yes stop_codon:yes gene_type:complete
MNRTDFKNTNLNYQNPKVIKTIKRVLGKGTILEWKKENTFHHTQSAYHTGKFRVTSLKINSWGSIYINLRLLKGKYYERPLRERFTENTKYANRLEINNFKWNELTEMVYNQAKLFGYGGGSIFVKRLSIQH